MNKRSLRVEWAIDSMAAKGDCYFYTFTTPDIVSCKECASRWRLFVRSGYWQSIYSKDSGNHYLMVFEKHSNGHGWHIHFVTNFRHDVDMLRLYTWPVGFGRINAVYCGRHTDALGRYLGKYVSKQFRKRDPETKGVRLCNVSRGLTTLRRIEVSSPALEFVKLCLNDLPAVSRSVRFALFSFFKFAYYVEADITALRVAFHKSPVLQSRGFSVSALQKICKKNQFSSCA